MCIEADAILEVCMLVHWLTLTAVALHDNMNVYTTSLQQVSVRLIRRATPKIGELKRGL